MAKSKKAVRNSVVIVDDDRDVVSLLSVILSDEYDVTSFTTGQEALEYLRSNCPSILISDLRMPVIDGFMLVIEARRLCQQMKVVVITGETDPHPYSADQQSILDDFVDLVLAKPFSVNGVLSRLKRLMCS